MSKFTEYLEATKNKETNYIVNNYESIKKLPGYKKFLKNNFKDISLQKDLKSNKIIFKNDNDDSVIYEIKEKSNKGSIYINNKKNQDIFDFLSKGIKLKTIDDNLEELFDSWVFSE